MTDFIPGQRWISASDLQMGLGTVLETSHRSVTIVFMATGETRIYAKESAPLTRVRFDIGDTILSHEGWGLIVDGVSEANGLLTYTGMRDEHTRADIHESDLNNFIQLNRPTDRLFSGQIDQNKWFELRYQTLQHLNHLSHSDLRGLGGCRTSLIPHQLYIAHEVASRYAPRVLLADEVGLGKTIEAGLILHYQLLTERAHRVIIVVPETLLHQWLVEMIRRFNLHFSIFDEERCQAAEESSGQDNPFHTEQLVLCSLEFLTNHPKRYQQAIAGQWDLLVVDEAHHLQWSPEEASTEYTIIEQLANVTQGVLLLTATPEQLGKESHFARLRILDPDRFHNYDAFLEEEKSYEPVAQAVEELLGHEPLSNEANVSLTSTLDEGDNADLLETLSNDQASREELHQAREALVTHLLDRHGTGRVLFRNTRSAVKGFPERQIHSYSLPLPQAYKNCIGEFQSSGIPDPQLLLSPEQLYQATATSNTQHWSQVDPRIGWLTEKLKQLKPSKVLVITSSASTAQEIAEILRTREGIHAAVFYEGLSIVERDRAAAYFADQEYGTQVLVCSEIGSEGRNFQFAHHLILFDLPVNPDLLEQRIGRLDRIGQRETINIHVPYLEGSAQETMFYWYHRGLSAFEHTCPAGHHVFTQVESTLIDALHQPEEALEDVDSLIDTTRVLHQQYTETLQRGRNRLLEKNSCRPDIANALKSELENADAESSLPDYMESLYDCFGIEIDVHSENSFVIKPGNHMQAANFPGLLEDGMTITYDRETALIYEDTHFLTWEHPMVIGAMDMVLDDEKGNTAVIAVKHSKIPPGSLMLECIYLLESHTPALNSSRYLPPTTIRLVINTNEQDLTTALTHDIIKRIQISIDKNTANKVVRSQSKEIRALITKCDSIANQKAPSILQRAHQQVVETLQNEIDRLIALRQVNPNVRDNEIEYFESQIEVLDESLETTTPRLESLRVIVST